MHSISAPLDGYDLRENLAQIVEWIEDLCSKGIPIDHITLDLRGNTIRVWINDSDDDDSDVASRL